MEDIMAEKFQMTQKGYESLNDFKGLMNAKKQGSAAAFERSQFFKQFGKYE